MQRNQKPPLRSESNECSDALVLVVHFPGRKNHLAKVPHLAIGRVRSSWPPLFRGIATLSIYSTVPGADWSGPGDADSVERQAEGSRDVAARAGGRRKRRMPGGEREGGCQRREGSLRRTENLDPRRRWLTGRDLAVGPGGALSTNNRVANGPDMAMGTRMGTVIGETGRPHQVTCPTRPRPRDDANL